jgi:transcriptional regulator with XRE-family HTH domain
MKELMSFEQMLNNLKEKNENTKLVIEATQKTVEIINKIVKARENLGLSQRALAEKCNIKQPALARIETLKVIPQINTLIKIANAVGINIEAISSVEKEKMEMCISISQAVINTSLYSNNLGGYLWTQKSIAFRS